MPQTFLEYVCAIDITFFVFIDIIFSPEYEHGSYVPKRDVVTMYKECLRRHNMVALIYWGRVGKNAAVNICHQYRNFVAQSRPTKNHFACTRQAIFPHVKDQEKTLNLLLKQAGLKVNYTDQSLEHTRLSFVHLRPVIRQSVPPYKCVPRA